MITALPPGRPGAYDAARGSRSVLTLCPGPACGARSDDPDPMRHGQRSTLDDLIVAAWEGLAWHRSVACPVCGGPMAPRYGSGAAPVGGRCSRCGSSLG